MKEMRILRRMLPDVFCQLGNILFSELTCGRPRNGSYVLLKEALGEQVAIAGRAEDSGHDAVTRRVGGCNRRRRNASGLE